MDDKLLPHSSQVIFLLGAGASKKADVPTTYDFVIDFIKYLEDDYKPDSDNEGDAKKIEVIRYIVQVLKQWRKKENQDVDIELLLETLIKFKNIKNDSLMQFCQEKERQPFYGLVLEVDSISIDDCDKIIDELINNLKSFIKLRTIVKEEKIEYLRPFRGFIEMAKSRGHPLDIVSLNYDTCIEQFCNVHKMTYQDGFDLYWNPETFGRYNNDVNLYKLHGSVIWYQSDRGTYIKLPIQNEFGEIKLISNERAENLMLYPMQKWDYAEPLLELLLKVKYMIESELPPSKDAPSDKFKFLIAVGYSFRDEHIKKIIWDTARKNRNLYLLIIDPNARQIYDELRFYDEKKSIHSSVSGRTVCLPYKFEEIFPLLMDKYIDLLKRGLSSREDSQKSEDLAEKDRIRWKNCLYYLTKAEFSEMAQEIIRTKSLSFDEENSAYKIELFLPIFVNLLWRTPKNPI